MRILYFHQYFCTPEGNSGIRSYEMAKHLVMNGHKVTMIFAESPRLKSPLLNKPYKKGVRRGSYEGIDLIELNLKYNNKMNLITRAWVFLRYSFRSIRFVFTEEFDLLFATSTPLTAGIPGIAMKLAGKRKPFVFEVRDLWPELPREMGLIKNKFVLWLMDVLESISYNKANVCIALSPGIKQGIQKKLNKENPVYLIPNGSDLDLFKPGNHPKSIFPNCSENDFVAIFIGAHGIANGLDAALNAATVLLQKGQKNIKIILVGDGKLKPQLQKKVITENISNVIFLDPVAKNRLNTYLEASDVGLMLLSNIPAYYYGTSPNKFFDYISAGLPVLNNYPGWLAEMITENHLGIAIEPDNPEAFADAIIKMSYDKNLLKKMGENARSFAEREFNRKILAVQFEKVLVNATDNLNRGKAC